MNPDRPSRHGHCGRACWPKPRQHQPGEAAQSATLGDADKGATGDPSDQSAVARHVWMEGCDEPHRYQGSQNTAQCRARGAAADHHPNFGMHTS